MGPGILQSNPRSRHRWGVNLRIEHLDELLALKPSGMVFEAIGDNWLSPGPHHNKLLKLREDNDISLHFVGMNIGFQNSSMRYLQKCRELVELVDPVAVSDHLAIVGNSNGYAHDLIPVPYDELHLEICSTNVSKVQDVLGRQIFVENLSAYVEYSSSSILEFDFLGALAAQSGAGLIFDVNNLWVNCQNFNRDFKSQLDSLDLSAVEEMHIAGATLLRNVLVDDHGRFPDSQVLEGLKYLLQKTKREGLILVFEQDTNLGSAIDHLTALESIKEVIDDTVESIASP